MNGERGIRRVACLVSVLAFLLPADSLSADEKVPASTPVATADESPCGEAVEGAQVDRAACARWLDLGAEHAAGIEEEGARVWVLVRLAELGLEAGVLDVNAAGAKLATIPTADGKENLQEVIAGYQAETGDVEGAKTTAGSIKSKLARSSVLLRIADAQLRRGDLAGAKATAARVSEPVHFDVLYHRMARAQASAGDFAGAEATAALIRDPESRPRALKAVTGAKVVSGAADPARALAEAGFTAVEAEIALWQLAEGRVQGALKTAQFISADWRRTYVYCIVAHAAMTHGNLDAGRKAIHLAEVAADGEQDPKRQFACHLRIAEVLAGAGDVKGAHDAIARASSMVDQLGTKGKERLSRRTDMVEGVLVYALSAEGRMDEAFVLAKEKWADSLPSDVCRALSRGYVVSRRLDRLSEWIEGLDRPIQRAYACIGAVEAFIEQPQEQGGSS